MPVTGSKAQLVSFILDPTNNQKGKRKAPSSSSSAALPAGGSKAKAKAPKYPGAPTGQSKAAKAAREIAGPWSSDNLDDLVNPLSSERELRAYVTTCANYVDADW